MDILQLYWANGVSLQQLWAQVPELTLHEHLWIRKLAVDLLGLAFADETLCKLPTIFNSSPICLLTSPEHLLHFKSRLLDCSFESTDVEVNADEIRP